MKIEIRNSLVEQSIGLLFNLELKGKESRHRTKFIKRLEGHLKEVKASHEELLKEHSNLDEDGKPIIEDNHYSIKDMDELNKDLMELYEEKFIIANPADDEMLKTIADVLLNCEKAFSGIQASLYDELCNIFESAKGGDE